VARDAALTEPSPRALAQAWTVQKWLTDWLEQLDLRPSTLHGYASIVRCHLIPALGSRRLSELEPRDVHRAMDTIARKRTWRGVLAASTVTGVLSVLRSALGAARARGYIRFNPAFDALGDVFEMAHPAVVARPADADGLAGTGAGHQGPARCVERPGHVWGWPPTGCRTPAHLP
jgi:hypothetical protein